MLDTYYLCTYLAWFTHIIVKCSINAVSPALSPPLQVLPGLVNLCTRLIGAPSFTQSVVPLVMETDLTDYHRQSGSVLKVGVGLREVCGWV